MTTATRTDIHRPSAPEFDPQAYTLLGVLDLNPDPDDTWWSADWEELQDAIKEAGSPKMAEGKRTDRCGHCGQQIRYAAFMHHVPTNTFITVGEDCLDNRFTGMSATRFQDLRKRAALNRERKSRQERRDARLAKLVERDPRLAVLGDSDGLRAMANFFMSDLAYKLGDYDLSERQIEAAINAIDRYEERKRREAEEAANRVPAPSGRMEVTGEVLAITQRESMYGVTWKMLLKENRGFRVWLTAPQSLMSNDAFQEGCKVALTVTLEQSDKDETFAFGSRPTKATVVGA